MCVYTIAYPLRHDEEFANLKKRLIKLDLVLQVAFKTNVVANLRPFSPPTHNAHLHSSPSKMMNVIEVGDDIDDDQDWEGECEERRNSGKGVGSPHMWVEKLFVEET